MYTLVLWIIASGGVAITPLSTMDNQFGQKQCEVAGQNWVNAQSRKPNTNRVTFGYHCVSRRPE